MIRSLVGFRDTLAVHIPRIKRFFASKGLGPEDVEDLTQDVLLSAIEGIGKFRGESAVSTWLYGICRNTYRTHAYRLRRGRSIAEDLRNEYQDREVDAAVVRMVIEELPLVYRNVYLLYYQKGLSVRETAEILSRPSGTVKYLLAELRKRFRTEWL